MTASGKSFRVLKFGGTSLATADRIQRAVELVQRLPGSVHPVVVASALGGVTQRLRDAIDAAEARNEEYTDIIDELRDRHQKVLDDLVADEEERQAVETVLRTRWHELAELLDGVYLLRECTPRSRDAIISMGERTSVPLVAAALRAEGIEAQPIVASQLIRTDAEFGAANINEPETFRMIQDKFGELSDEMVPVVTGFIGSTEEGVITTLGPSGSDYSATIIGAALDADQVEIWTDVDGILSADPRMVPDAFPLRQLTYREASEMAYFGAEVLHPRTMAPLKERNIPLLIKNTMNPDEPGSRVSRESQTVRGHVKAVTTIQDTALLIIEGSGMLGVPGIAARAFGTLADNGINVLMISQASSEQSICIVVKDEDSRTAVESLRETFAQERRRGHISGITVRKDVAVLAAVGDNMRTTPGIAGHMFSTLRRNNVNVLAIAEGASESNLSIVIDDSDVKRALDALHGTFSLQYDRVHLALVGVGTVGTALLNFLDRQAEFLRERKNFDIRLIGVANSRQLVWDERGISISKAREKLESSSESFNIEILRKNLTETHLERVVLVDATASQDVARLYPELLEAGVSVVTPNKRANTLDYPFYERLHKAQPTGAPYFYETTVGAALPIISTLTDLLQSGDQVHKIECMLSGTMGYVFSRLMEGEKFSAIVREAREAGYTEPDPREDLSGEDVARKLLILARELGLTVERSDIEVESLSPEGLDDLSVDEFLEELPQVDSMWAERVEQSRESGHRLQYMGTIEDNSIRVGVQEIDESSPFARLRGTNNMVAFTTDRYQEDPLIVQGPGAGPEITAAGVLADLIKAAERMK